jgi:uncharacterized membrane protein
MENRPDQQPAQSARPSFPFDPNMLLTYEEQPHAYADFTWQAGRPGAEREASLGKAMGWLSMALGAAQLLAPRSFARATGLPEWLWLYRAIGARELACGIGLLAQPKSAAWRWARVVGDSMDAAVLGAAMFSPVRDRRRLAATAALAAGITAMDVRASAARRRRPSSEELPGTGGKRHVLQTITVNYPPDECYGFWRNFESFPRFMRHVEEVRHIDDQRSHWVATGPAGRHVEWDAEITLDEPNRQIAWRSIERADVHNSGSVRFSPSLDGRGTLIEVEMDYRPPAGRAGAVVAMLFGEEPSLQIEGDLRRFKQLIETGEIPTTRGQPHGQRTLKSRLFNRALEPAQQAKR